MERLHLGYDEAYGLPTVDGDWLLENLWELDKARGEVGQSAK
jgi:hypothetical protein